MFVGVIFLVIGMSILLNACFGFHLPIFRTLFALFFIYLGVQMLFGHFWKFPWKFPPTGGFSNSSMFSNMAIKPKNEDEIQDTNILFGKAVVDLTAIQVPSKTVHLSVNTLFGETEVLINSKTPVRIQANAAFGEVKMPNENSVAFGSLNYRANLGNDSAAYIELHGNVLFGLLQFRTKE